MAQRPALRAARGGVLLTLGSGLGEAGLGLLDSRFRVQAGCSVRVIRAYTVI